MQLKSLLHLGQNVITFRTLLHLGQNVITFRTLLHVGSFITFRPSTYLTKPTFLFHRWLNFERVISALTERNVDYLNVEEVQVIAREKCFITNEKEFDLMMNFYHDLGIIVKHGTTVILNAKWLIELFRKLITIPKSNEMIRKCTQLKQGIKSFSLILC